METIATPIKSKGDSHHSNSKTFRHVLFCIRFIFLVLTFQAYHRVVPDHLCELFRKYHAIRAIRHDAS